MICNCSSRIFRPLSVRRSSRSSSRSLPSSEVGRRYNVSTRTVTRWRRQGLVARRFVMAGRTKVGFLESSLERFVATHRDQVERGSRFRQLTDAERDEIVRRARRMALYRPGQVGPGRSGAEDRTEDGTFHGDDSTDLEGLRSRAP